jgi:thiamine transporter ThiT
MVGALLISVENYIPAFIQNIISNCIAIICAFIVAKFVWNKIKRNDLGFIRTALKGGFILGSIGFIIGFIGPIVFYPSSNQGPLLGIFITGPLGFILGLIAGAIYWQVKLKNVVK